MLDLTDFNRLISFFIIRKHKYSRNQWEVKKDENGIPIVTWGDRKYRIRGFGISILTRVKDNAR